MKNFQFAFAGIIIASTSAAVGYWWGNHDEMRLHETSPNNVAPPAVISEKNVLYWYDPMVPNQHFDKPGKSPFMDMELVPKYAEENETMPGLKIDANVQQNLALRRAIVERKKITSTLEVLGNFQYNARDIAVMQARSSGFVDRVYAHAPGDVISKDTPLVDLSIPEWAAAQAEYLALLQHREPELTSAARQRLTLLGMPENVITDIERSGQAKASITITAPIAGVIQALDVRQGMAVSAGATLATINGIDPVWLEAAIPEKQIPLVKEGETLNAHLTGYPDESFLGCVLSLLPDINTQTRTFKLRAEFPNPDGRLRPGMYARVEIESGKNSDQLWVPTEAVIHTGERDLVILENENNSFLPQEITTGEETQEHTAVLSGLKEGQTVIVSGQFLLDSEANLRGFLQKIDPPNHTQKANKKHEHFDTQADVQSEGNRGDLP